MKLSIGQQVQSASKGLGIVLEINGINVTVDFQGEIKTVFAAALTAPKAAKIKSYMKAEVADVWNFNAIKNNLINPNSTLFFGDSIYNNIERLADSQNHFAGQIIADVRNGKNITEKQACVVAFFAKNNGFLNA